MLDAQWRYTDQAPDEPLIQIPCVLGACYAMSKRYWLYLRGLAGLHTYGCDETYLSLKTWLEGGICLLMKNIKVGHIFRKKAPFDMCTRDLIYNKLLIAETVLPVEHKKIVFREMDRSNPEATGEAMQMLCGNRQMVAELKNYYRQIFTWNVDAFVQVNQSMKT